jgi:hypothetical protein
MCTLFVFIILDVQEANIKAEGEFKHAQQVHEEAKCEVQRLTEAICIETGQSNSDELKSCVN